MRSQENRLKRLQDKAPAEPVFLEWKGGRHWTEEKKAEAIRLHPECKMFWMSFVKRSVVGLRAETQRAFSGRE